MCDSTDEIICHCCPKYWNFHPSKVYTIVKCFILYLQNMYTTPYFYAYRMLKANSSYAYNVALNKLHLQAWTMNVLQSILSWTYFECCGECFNVMIFICFIIVNYDAYKVYWTLAIPDSLPFWKVWYAKIGDHVYVLYNWCRIYILFIMYSLANL